MKPIAVSGLMASVRKCISCGTQLGTLSEGEILTALKCARCNGEICIACMTIDKSQPFCKKCYQILTSPPEDSPPPEFEG